MNDYILRDAVPGDLPPLLEIYNDVVVHTTAIWSDELRTLAEQEAWFAERSAQGRPVLVAERAGEVAGYASYGAFRPWSGYRYSVESSVHLARPHRNRGLGGRLMQALIERARAQALQVMVAGVDSTNDASLRLHERLGFERAGHLHKVGRKFERWLDLILLEKAL